jgi:predicted transcriptional regulator
MTRILQRLLSGDVAESETSAEDRQYIDTLRKRRLVVRYTGPGPAWYRITGHGRVILSDTQVSRLEPMF